jgi:glycosyltransferase involved in cell wall biosynthesis
MILHVIENLFPESGGPPTVVIEFARHQARSGRRVAVICNRGPRKPEQRAALMETWRGLPIDFTDFSLLDASSRSGAMDRQLERLQPKIIHIHCMWESFVRTTAANARRRSIPYVISTHGMLHPYAIAQKRLKKWAYLTLFPQIIGGARELYSLNREEAAYVAKRFHCKSSVLANGIDAAEYSRATPDLFYERFPQFAHKSFILFVGRIHPIKGIDQLIRSYGLARSQGCDHQLVIAGPDDGCKAEIDALVDTLSLREHVHLVGGLFGEIKRSAFAACSVFAHRPRFEGFGITVVEGMAAGKPVVTTKECKLDGAGEAGALCVAPDTDEGFAEALVRVTREPVAARMLGAHAQAWVRTNLDWEALARVADESYAKAAGNPVG